MKEVDAMQKQIIYIVLAIAKGRSIEFGITEQRIPLIWADGMVGCLPAFDSKEAAEIYADGKCRVLAATIKEVNNDH